LQRTEQEAELAYEVSWLAFFCPKNSFVIFRFTELLHNFFLQQLLVLETNLFLGAFASHDRHRDMRMDIDNMSYEVFS
jgi:hypothetical protein